MTLIEVLKKKKIKMKETPKWGAHLRKQWEFHFANHLSRKEKEEIYLHGSRYASGYLWHVFSYEKKKCLQDERAERAFHNEVKKNCYIFYQHCDDVLILENASSLHVSDLLCETDGMLKGDIYVVDKEFAWTYVKTHENGWCGPYFSRKNW
ncbi:DUF4275 family protein [Bacillus clarus]|uniref:DUF4275 family protein n=1 Tax=Bacillus clarus TaxID=2338372 RepID=A0A090YLI4_9BACI|nr:DUF4275 family protein [Bacillus clarus]KFM99334.1 hypothetical protein DJ93_2122 [Bacillus clarus]RFT66976.1 DUF4275 family protein [Bacillus clarus]